jgi:prepilin-type N-terminal cleavage/methylation domain-containing protein
MTKTKARKVFIKSKKGMTLVEVVVSLALLSILAILIMSVFASSFQVVFSNADMKKKGKDAAAGIENKLAGFDPDGDISIIRQQRGTFSIDFGGVVIESSGNYVTGNDKEFNAEYHFFIPD